MISRIKKLGPGAIIAAAFIGPGTVTTATKAGAQYGYTLLWAVLFSLLATFILQEMAARVGIMSKMGLGQAVRKHLQPSWVRTLAIGLIISAIFIGNSAYESGNIAGALWGATSQ